MKTEKLKHPTTKIVHWPTGPVQCCDKHADEVVKLGSFMGAYTPVSYDHSPTECKNCVNENKDKE